MKFLRAFSAITVEAWRQLEAEYPRAGIAIVSSNYFSFAFALVLEANLQREETPDAA